MQKVKIILYKQKKLSGGCHPLMIRITGNNQREYISTGLRSPAGTWDEADELPNQNYKAVNGLLTKSELVKKIQVVKDRIEKTKYSLEDSGIQDWSPAEFVVAYGTKKKGRILKVMEAFDEKVSRELLAKSVGNSFAYRNAKKALERFLKHLRETDNSHKNKTDLMFPELTVSFINKFIEWSQGKGNKPNTTSIYLRNIRALYKYAITEGYVNPRYYPFGNKQIEMPKGQSFKRALKEVEYIKFRDEPLEDPELERSREYFLFMFYCYGLNFIDLANLKLSNYNIVTNELNYERAKTGTNFKIRLFPPAKKILDKYIENKLEDDYIFPILNPNFPDEKSKYYRIIKERSKVNKNLRTIAKKAGILSRNITTYVSRHSYSSIMRDRQLATVFIQQSLGHKDSKTTETYLSEIDPKYLSDIIESKMEGL